MDDRTIWNKIIMEITDRRRKDNNYGVQYHNKQKVEKNILIK